jgi:hypothetical protein
MRHILLLSLLFMRVPAWAAPSTFDTPNALPPVIEDTTKAAMCTVTYLIANAKTNDMIAVRMRVEADQTDRPVNNLMPCPKEIPPRLASHALDACILRAGDSKDCVYADMGRDFDTHANVNNSAENTSRCSSDRASDIGVACWRSGVLDVCGVGCGDSPAASIAAAVTRCEIKHQKQCPITGSLPVLAPR